MDLKQTVLEQLSGAVKDKIAAKTGIESSKTDDAVGTAVDAILGGLQGNVKTEKGAQKLDQALGKGHDGSLLEDLSSAVGSGDVAADGAKILGHIFGKKNADSVAEKAAEQAGTSSSQMGDLMSILAPIVMSQLGKSKASEGLDAGGIADKILRQKLPDNQMTNIITQLIDRDKDGQIIDDLLSIGQDLFKKK